MEFVKYFKSILKKNIFVILILVTINSCEKYSHSKFYDFIVENHLTNKIVKIVPKSQSEFWIYKTDTFKVIPKQKIIIGAKDDYNDDKVVQDLYKPDDIIEQFDLYVDSEKQTKDFTKKLFWAFSIGSVDESGKYTLIIDEYILKSK